MDILNQITAVFSALVSVLMLYKVVYTVIGFLCKAKRYPDTDHLHTYGIVIAARNEQAVIGHLLDSIRQQHYDMSRVKVFVVADNCTDATAAICREKGAVVYERHDTAKARKGYALEYLFDHIATDFGIDCVEGYIIFDADNLLHPDYLAEINKAFDTGVDIAVGYRNIKNFAHNPISSAYGIHFYRSTMQYHRPRALLGLPTHIAGTGYVLRSHLLAEGWHFTSLTEDTQFTLVSIARGRHIAFCEAATFYDEQPHEVRVMLRQRIRWAKGRLFCFFCCAPGLLKGIFKKPCGGKRFACYDMFFYALPKALLSALASLLFALISAIVVGVTVDPAGAGAAALSLLRTLGTSYLSFALIGALTVIRERRKIPCPTGKLVLYVLTFPLFDLIGLPISLVSLCMRVKWKPIKHDEAIRVEEIVSEVPPTENPQP